MDNYKVCLYCFICVFIVKIIHRLAECVSLKGKGLKSELIRGLKQTKLTTSEMVKVNEKPLPVNH